MSLEKSNLLTDYGNIIRMGKPFKDDFILPVDIDINKMSEYEIFDIIEKEPRVLKFINNPTLDMVLLATKLSPNTIYYVKELTKEMLYGILERDKDISNSYDRIFPNLIPYINNLSMEYLEIIMEYCGFSRYVNIAKINKEKIRDCILKNEGYYLNLIKIIDQKDKLESEFLQELIDLYIKRVINNRLVKPKHLLRDFTKSKQCEELCITAIDLSWENYKYCTVKSKNVYLKCLKYNSKYAKNLMEEFNTSVDEILDINGMALKYVDNPSHSQIVKALNQNGKAILYVKDQTPEYCLLAVKQNSLALRYVKNPTDEVLIESCKNKYTAFNLIEDKEKRDYIRSIIKK